MCVVAMIDEHRVHPTVTPSNRCHWQQQLLDPVGKQPRVKDN